MLPGVKPPPGRLHPDKPDILIVQKGVEDADSIATATDTGHDIVGQPSQSIQQLLPGFLTDYRLEVTHYRRIGMRTDYRAQQVLGIPVIGHPVSHRLVDGIL